MVLKHNKSGSIRKLSSLTLLWDKRFLMKSDKMSDLRKNIFRNQKITRKSEKVQFEWIWNEIKTCKLFKKRLCAKLKWNEILKWKEKKINKQILHCKFSIKKSQNLTCKIIMNCRSWLWNNILALWSPPARYEKKKLVINLSFLEDF